MRSLPRRLTWLALGIGVACLGGVPGVALEPAGQAGPAPDFTTTTLDGKTLRLRDYRGKVVLLDFWGAWCPPCREVAPDLVAMHDRHAKEPFTIIGLSSDSAASVGLLREFLFTSGMKWPQVHDFTQTIAQKYAVFSYPAYVVIDGDGNQRARFDGKTAVKDIEGSVRQWVRALVVPSSDKSKTPARAVASDPVPRKVPESSPVSHALTRLLQRVAGYLDHYEKQISMVVAEELYVQMSDATSSSGTETRTLKSDILVVDLGAVGWTGFRDVFEVDGQSVRDHQNRLLALVTSPSSDTLTQARRLAAEGARFNIGAVARTINMPTVGLKFLRLINQPRSGWKLGGRRKIDGRDTVELTFSETGMPRLIETQDQAPARGRFWVEEATGRIVQSELGLDTSSVRASVSVTFGAAPNVIPWVPLRLEEAYRPIGPPRERWGPGSRNDAHATYSRFRTFPVTSNTVIK